MTAPSVDSLTPPGLAADALLHGCRILAEAPEGVGQHLLGVRGADGGFDHFVGDVDHHCTSVRARMPRAPSPDMVSSMTRTPCGEK